MRDRKSSDEILDRRIVPSFEQTCKIQKKSVLFKLGLFDAQLGANNHLWITTTSLQRPLFLGSKSGLGVLFFGFGENKFKYRI